MKNKPHVLLFFTDDQRFDTIHALGNERISTPNLDKLVERGTCFTHACIPGGTCGAVCMPSRAMLHTGRTLFHIEKEGQEIPRTHKTLGECLRSAGYDSFGTGKWHNGRPSFARGFSCGDEIFFGGMQDHWNVPVYRFDPGGGYNVKTPYIADPFRSNKVEHRECDHITAGKHSTDIFVDSAIRFLEERNSCNPFFMYVSLMAPHDPRSMPEQFMRMYDPEQIALPDNFLSEHPIDTGALKIRDELLASFPRNPDEIKRHIAEYYAMISHLDFAFGRLVASLREKDMLENTIVIFAGDNGLSVGQHGLMGKQNLYDHSIRVPLVFAGPGIPEGQRCPAPVYLSDIFPTICDLTGITVPETSEGSCLTPCIKGRKTEVHACLYLAYANSIRGVTDGRHKLIEYACGATQFFDLSRDPSEKHNLAGEKQSASVIARMRQNMLDLSEEWHDKLHPTGLEFWAQRSDLRK